MGGVARWRHIYLERDQGEIKRPGRAIGVPAMVRAGDWLALGLRIVGVAQFPQLARQKFRQDRPARGSMTFLPGRDAPVLAEPAARLVARGQNRLLRLGSNQTGDAPLPF